MAITVGVLKDLAANEKRVSIVPDGARTLTGLGANVLVESEAGDGAFFNDDDYELAGAKVVALRQELLEISDIIITVQRPSIADIKAMRKGAFVVGLIMPDRYPDIAQYLMEKGITAFSLEKIPRISRAQAMDVLTSQSSVAGYSATILAAEESPRFLPMLTTAAGTIRPSRVLVVGAGVSGLMAIATARRLGASVTGYDIRRTAGEDIKSLGARFLNLNIEASTSGGYARELTH